MRTRLLLSALVVLSAAPLRAQDPAPAPPPAPTGDVALKFEREVYNYPMDGRRDPFTPLIGRDNGAPRFEDLTLRGIIFSPTPGRSVALFVDAAGKIHRARRGDRVGNARIVDVGPRRVVLSVEDFGRARQEILELKRKVVEGPKQ
jgi:hypothetical protein